MVLALESRAVAMILLHEEEHLARKDTHFLAAALVLAAVLPWNLPLWWHFRRLRLAVECDCDARVLRRGVEWSEYGSLLVTIGERVRKVGLPAAALAESPSLLERRITMLTRKIPAARGWKAALAAVAGVAVIVFACETPPPTEIAVEPAFSPEAAKGEISHAPTFTPFTTAPELKNAAEVQESLSREYPPMLREAGVEGTVEVYMFVNAEGIVERALVHRSSGESALDEAAVRVASDFLFSPAQNREARVPVWILMPITFR